MSLQDTQRSIRQIYQAGNKKTVQLEKLPPRSSAAEKAGVFLNGRRVMSKCPVLGCQSEKGYADECDLGHQYMPSSLIDPKSTLTGETPVMRDVVNWYFRLTGTQSCSANMLSKDKGCRSFRSLCFKDYRRVLELAVVHIKERTS